MSPRPMRVFGEPNYRNKWWIPTTLAGNNRYTYWFCAKTEFQWKGRYTLEGHFCLIHADSIFGECSKFACENGWRPTPTNSWSPEKWKRKWKRTWQDRSRDGQEEHVDQRQKPQWEEIPKPRDGQEEQGDQRQKPQWEEIPKPLGLERQMPLPERQRPHSPERWKPNPQGHEMQKPDKLGGHGEDGRTPERPQPDGPTWEERQKPRWKLSVLCFPIFSFLIIFLLLLYPLFFFTPIWFLCCIMLFYILCICNKNWWMFVKFLSPGSICGM